MRSITAAMTSVALTIAATGNAAPPTSPNGFYVGADIGTAKAHTTVPAGIVWQTNVDSSTTGWSLFGGFRPNRHFGGEIDYIDFGDSAVYNISDGFDLINEAHAKNHALAGYLMGYLPLTPDSWDVFAKAGYARLTTETFSNGSYPNICAGTPCSIVGNSHQSNSNTTGNFAWGLGTQYRFGSVALRAEYQQINGSQAHPDMYSIGVAWNF